MLPCKYLLLFVAVIVSSVNAFGNNEDKFIKKYAMMKIYESCFGQEVVRQIRKEMKAACAKCAALETPSQLTPTATINEIRPQTRPLALPPPISSDSNKHAEEGGLFQVNQIPSNAFDVEKLQQAILSFRPTPFSGGAAPAYRPYQPSPYYHSYPQQQQQPIPYPNYYGYQQAVPYSVGNPYAGFPLFAQQYLGNNRASREMDIKSQIEALTARLSGRVRNVTCVMQELGYLDGNLEPNFEKINERISNLPVSEDLRKDMQEGVEFCQQFSQCVPEIKRDKSPLSRELVRPMFFFKCYKHKKLEACIMKDVREKYAGVTDDDFDGDVGELRRTSKSAKFDAENSDDLATSMYDFLYGSDSSVDMDTLF